jgi:serine acetyltransferase
MFKSCFNRILQLLARSLPGATSLRPCLHKLRGVKITGRVWIGEDVFLENTYPESIELHDECGVNLRSVLLAHWRGSGKIIVEKKARIGACCLITASPGETIVIGEGSMVAAGSVVTKSVAPYTLVAGVPAKPIATLKYAPSKGISYKQFKSGITRISPVNTQEGGVPDPEL